MRVMSSILSQPPINNNNFDHEVGTRFQNIGITTHDQDHRANTDFINELNTQHIPSIIQSATCKTNFNNADQPIRPDTRRYQQLDTRPPVPIVTLDSNTLLPTLR